MADHLGEKITEGLDGLRDRLAEYSQMGARFAKWRAVIAIGDSIPSQGCIEANAQILARYAALCQEAGLRARANTLPQWKENDVSTDDRGNARMRLRVRRERSSLAFGATHPSGNWL